jgi:hypothetical protein
MKKILLSVSLVGVALAGAFWLWPGSRVVAQQAIDPSCTAAATPQIMSGTNLDTFATTKDGVVYDGTGAKLQLQRGAGSFTGTTLGVGAKIFIGCAGDFDNDGWTDFVASGSLAFDYVKFFKNETYTNPAPADWTIPTNIRTPNFVDMGNIENGIGLNNAGVMACGDVNGDGNMDFVYMRCLGPALCIPTRYDVFLGNGNGTFQTPYPLTSTLGLLGYIGWTSNSIGFVDYNKDGHLDMVMGQNGLLNIGRVSVLLSDGAAQPKFNTKVDLLTNQSYGTRGPVAIGVGDYNGDNVPDIVVGGPATTKLFMYPGLLGGGVGTPEDLNMAGYTGGATAILSGDFTLSGKNSVLVASDGNNGLPGGKVFFYQGDGTPAPFAAGIKQTIVTASPDFDLGWAFDYDHDPDGTLDFVMADGNNSGAYYLFANRTQQAYVDCGTVTSAVVDVGSLATTESTVTSIRLTPDPPAQAASDGTISWEASNDNGATWHVANACPDDATKVCVNFTTSAGNQIRWRVTMCSNTSDHTRTPVLFGVTTDYTFVTAQNHFRAGPIAKDGLIYVGAFRMPGNAGHVFAVADETGQTVWDAADKLDATSPSSRNVFTVADDGTRLDFNSSNASNAALQATLLAPDQTTAQSIIDWYFSPRFGLLSPKHVLGAVENSTPALLSLPTAPYWYVYSSTPDTERQAIDAYIASLATRPQLLFIGAKDGALHAFHTNPDDAADPANGTEAWGFIPFDVAQRMLGDKTSGGDSTAYVDGSPTLVSAKIGGAWKTVLIEGESNGGRAIFALDVTDTVTSGGVVGPTPLWRFQDTNMGRTYSKATVIRTQVGGVETWMAIFASGPGYVTDVGDTVYALDLTTGALLWRFDLNDTNTYVATDITASETDDESGTAIDGFIDRIFFADNKGRIWKLDPASYDAVNQTIAPVGSSVDVGLGMPALFSTRVTANALGQDRAIAGTLTAATDATNRLTLYFGTGGTEDTPPNVQNAFYAVYADTGEIRSALDQNSGIAIGVKFYGGVVYNNGQLVFTSGQDLSGLGLCAPTAGSVVAIDANTFALQFETVATSKIVAPLYAQQGEIYTVTITGKLMASQFVGQQGGTAPGTGGPGNPGPGLGPGGVGGDQGVFTTPFTVLGWRQIQ